jgi:hypothetical protein
MIKDRSQSLNTDETPNSKISFINSNASQYQNELLIN